MKRKPVSDILLVRKLVANLTEAQMLIDARRCLVNGVVILNTRSEVDLNASIKIIPAQTPVSRAQEKLRGALDAFGISVEGKFCADLGSSTGGFTQLLLERGAVRVYAVDTASGELAWSLRQDKRVIVWEGTNVTAIDSFPEEVELVTIDISLVSLTIILPAVYSLLKPGSYVVALIKPQYESSEVDVPSGGVLKDGGLQQQAAIVNVCHSAENIGFQIMGLMRSTLKGKSGNQEYPILLRR